MAFKQGPINTFIAGLLRAFILHCTVASKEGGLSPQTYLTPGPCPSWETYCHFAGWTTPTQMISMKSSWDTRDFRNFSLRAFLQIGHFQDTKVSSLSSAKGS